MPNWCSQYCIVKGSPEALQEFIERVRIPEELKLEFKLDNPHGEIVHSLNHLYPCPEELRETISGSYGDPEKEAELKKQQDANIEKYGYPTWYEWAQDNWGTKWGACNVRLDEEIVHGCLDLQFDSAWGPSVGLLEKVSAQFPSLTIGVYCREEADFFACWYVFHKGEIVFEGEVDVDGCPEMEADDPTDSDWEEYYERFNKWSASINDTLITLVESAMDDLQDELVSN